MQGDILIDIEFTPPIAELEKALGKLEKTLRDKALHSATVAAAKPYKDAMKREAPLDTGILRLAIGHKKLSRTAKGRLGIASDDSAVLVGPNRKVRGRARARVAALLEEGAKPHIIRPRKRGGVLSWVAGLAVKSVRHPGFRPNPFMRRAHESAGGDVQRLFYQGLAKQLDKIAS